MKHRVLLAAALAASPLLACGSSASDGDGTAASGDGTTCSSASTFPATPLSTIDGDNGTVRVAVYSAPYEPLVAGPECVQLIITNPSTGAGVDGLALTMTPWMTAMGHGASVTPAVTPLGGGRYVFTDVSLSMPGEWQLRTKITGSAIGAAGDSVEPTYSVD